MFNCPECNKETVWNNDWDDNENGQEIITSLYTCSDCDIDIIKRHYCNPEHYHPSNGQD